MRKSPPILLIILALVLFLSPPLNTYAAVGDNVGNSSLDMRVGQYADTADEHTVFGLIKSIINKQGSLADAIVTVDSKITDASSKIDPAVTDINAQVSSSTDTLTSTINTQVEGLSAKVDTTTNTLSSKIDDQTTGLSSQMSNVANKVESSTNELTSKIDAQSIGTYEDLVTAKTVFGMLHKIFDKLAALDAMSAMMIDMQTSLNHIRSQSDKIDSMSAMMINMQTNIDRMSNQMANQTALSGSGYTYTMWTKRSYLEGYKLKLTDRTTSKSCYVAWDEDSEYWSGVLKAPLKADIWISLINPSTGESQGELSITPTLTDGCAVIDLDSLMAGQISTVLGVNGPLATEVYKDPYFTKNEMILDAVVAGMAAHDEHLQDFVKSSTDLEIASTNLDEWYANNTEFMSVVGSSDCIYLLNNSTIGNYVAKSKDLLKLISTDRTVALRCNSASSFRNYLNNAPFTKKTKSVVGGSVNSISGNLICLSVTSGSRGDSYVIADTLIDFDYDRDECGNTNSSSENLANKLWVSASTSFNVVCNNYLRTIGESKSTSGISGYNRYYYRYWSDPGYRYTYKDLYGSCSTTSASYNSYVGMFADSITVPAFSSRLIAMPKSNCGRQPDSKYASSPSANSVITYIDLNE